MFHYIRPGNSLRISGKIRNGGSFRKFYVARNRKIPAFYTCISDYGGSFRRFYVARKRKIPAYYTSFSVYGGSIQTFYDGWNREIPAI
jgi:hypothetical protein